MRPEGDNTGSGIKNQLGRPTNLGEYAVLVREAIQNSWDARMPGSSTSFRIELRTLGKSAAHWSRLFGGSSLPAEQSLVLNKLDEETPLLIISDRGTSGLGGPLRSDRTNTSGETADFVQFMRNVGEPRDSELGGGTYGYGKGIFYRVSSASAIVVNSRHNGSPDSKQRLMGAALSEAYDGPDGRRFTGRHWWGEINDGIPDPVLNESASSIASQLGLPDFNGDETGTDIAVIAPELGLESEEETLETLAERIRGYIYWYLWPKFETKQRPRGLDFSVRVNGQNLVFPPVESVPVIRNLAKTLDDIAGRKGTSYSLKKYEPNELGEFSVDYVVSAAHTLYDEEERSILSFSPMNPPYRHVARMRQAELVVDYLPVAAMPTAEVGYVGTFRSSAYSDDSFAKAEPATHDNWSTAGLTGNDLGIVRGAKRFIESEADSLVAARSGAKSRLVQGLGRLSTQLGGFLAPLPSESSCDERFKSTGRKRGTGNRNVAIDNGQSPLTLEDGKPIVRHAFELIEPVESDAYVSVNAFVLLVNGKRENPDAAPAGSDQPNFLGWFAEGANTPIHADQTLKLKNLQPGTYSAKFKPVPDAAVKTTLEMTNV